MKKFNTKEMLEEINLVADYAGSSLEFDGEMIDERTSKLRWGIVGTGSYPNETIVKTTMMALQAKAIPDRPSDPNMALLRAISEARIND